MCNVYKNDKDYVFKRLQRRIKKKKIFISIQDKELIRNFLLKQID